MTQHIWCKKKKNLSKRSHLQQSLEITLSHHCRAIFIAKPAGWWPQLYSGPSFAFPPPRFPPPRSQSRRESVFALRQERSTHIKDGPAGPREEGGGGRGGASEPWLTDGPPYRQISGGEKRPGNALRLFWEQRAGFLFRAAREDGVGIKIRKRQRRSRVNLACVF